MALESTLAGKAEFAVVARKVFDFHVNNLNMPCDFASMIGLIVTYIACKLLKLFVYSL
jgi:hypothetical protein